MPSLVRQPAENPLLRVLAGELALDKGSVSYLENDVLYEMEATTAFYLSQFEHLYHTDFENNVSVLEPMRREEMLCLAC